MYTYNVNKFFSGLVLSLVILTFFSFYDAAEAQQGGAGIGITPAIIETDDDFIPGQIGQFSVKVSNLSDIDQTFYLSKRDIIGVREGGVPIFATQTTEKTGFEISEWITLSTEELFIPAKQEVEIPFLVTVPEIVAPGNHFGSIIITVDPPRMRESGAGIGYEVANIISIRIAGDANESARIRQFSTSKYIYGTTDVDFSVRIENEGNTLIKPTGPLEIVNMFGKKVAMMQFNESQAGVFPKTQVSPGTRDYEISWEDESPGFGRYEAILSVVYGSQEKFSTISSTVTFWILPMNIITPALIVLLVVCLVVYFSVRMYVRRTMAVAASGVTRRLVRSRRQNQFPVLLVFISMLAISALFFIVLLLLFA